MPLTVERRNEVAALTKALVSRRSYSGQEKDAAEELRRYLTAHGFDRVETDGYGNVTGRLRGRGPGPRLLFDGHLDTVPVADAAAWTHPPFAPEEVDGKLYGRGASDMKGAVAAFTAAAGFFARDREFPGEIWVAGVVHEECFEGVAARKISEAVQPDYVVIGEASQCDLKIGQRGRAEIVVETFGVPAHSANPEKGVNAVYGMCRVIEALRRLEAPAHPVLGRGILELTDICSSPYPGASVVPSRCRATYDRRLLVGETRESVLAPINAALEELRRSGVRAAASYAQGEAPCYTGEVIRGERFFPGWLYAEEEPFIQAVLEELRGIGQDPKVAQYGFCTNGSHYAGEADIRTIGYGPSLESLAHTDDEYIEISQLEKACEGYYAIMKALLR